MSTNYGKHVSSKLTPQTQAIFGRTDQVKNNAGGYVFEINDNNLLERFLTIGSEGGTYYVGEDKLTKENATQIIKIIKKDGLTVLNKVKEMVTRAPKRDPSIFVLALVCTFASQEVKNEAYKAIKDICKTSTHLFTFVANIKHLRGFSRGLRRGIADFYTSRNPDQLAYQLVKYRQRNGWTHKDVIKLSHPVAKNDNINELFKYSIGKSTGPAMNTLVDTFELAQKTTDTKELIFLIKEHRLTWEMIPTQMLNNKDILIALLQDMPFTAMLRNLNRMTKAGLFESNISNSTKLVVSRLTNKELLQKAGVHPINLLNTLRTYSQGYSDKSKLTWEPNQKIVDALNEAFNLSFETVVPTGKNILVAVDISGSMNASVGGMSLRAKEVAAALSLTLIKSEPNLDLIWFDTQAYKPKVGKRSSYDEVLSNTPNGGGTDCSLAYSYAATTKVQYDAVVILTDNETWAGKTHTVQLFDAYKKLNPKSKHVVVGLSATQYSILKDNDPSVLHIAGMDNSVPNLINSFISGR